MLFVIFNEVVTLKTRIYGIKAAILQSNAFCSEEHRENLVRFLGDKINYSWVSPISVCFMTSSDDGNIPESVTDYVIWLKFHLVPFIVSRNTFHPASSMAASHEYWELISLYSNSSLLVASLVVFNLCSMAEMCGCSPARNLSALQACMRWVPL